MICLTNIAFVLKVYLNEKDIVSISAGLFRRLVE